MRRDPAPNDPYRTAVQFADRIELELRRLREWREDPLPEAALASREAFCADTMTFFQWLQHVLVHRLRASAAENGQFPENSRVGVYGIRALDGHRDASRILNLLGDLDGFLDSVARQPKEATRIAERYLDAVRSRNRDAALEFLTEASADYEFPDGGDSIESADYTTLQSAFVEGDWRVRCHALLRLRSGSLVERVFVLCLVSNRGAMLVDLDGSAAATKELLLGRMDQSDLELSGLGFDFDEEPDEEDEADELEELAKEEIAAPVETEEERRAFFRELTEKYWRARTAKDGSASARETTSPMSSTGFDVSRPEGIWESVTGFHEAFDDTGEWSGGVTVRTLVESKRGPFVVLTAFLKEGAIWRVDHTTSLNATAHWWLRVYGEPHPFATEKSPRRAAMSFWHWLQMNSRHIAMDYVTPESRNLSLPRIGSGEVWEFFFYLDQKEDAENRKAMVRVLINTADLVRIVHTPLVLRDGEWLVDLPRVLRQLPTPSN